MHDAIVSIMHKVNHFYIDKDYKVMVTLAGTFEQLGYGYAAIKASKGCNKSILMTVDPT